MGELRHKRIRGGSRETWGILNPYGDIWSTSTFETPEDAKRHLAKFWDGIVVKGVDLTAFKVIRVRVRVTAVLPVVQDQPGEAG